MTAKIFCPAKTAMQSGKAKTSIWHLEFEAEGAKRVEPLMGYTSSSDMKQQVRLKFDSKEDAIAYAERNGIDYYVVEPKQSKRRKIAYSDNFAFAKKIPWTH